MSVKRRNKQLKWTYRTVVKLPDGSKVRIFGTPTRNTKEAAERAEREHIDRTLKGESDQKSEVPTFEDWFNGRFWTEWVIGNQNKPSETRAKLSIYKHHLGPEFGSLRLNKIGVSEIAQFRAKLISQKSKSKRTKRTLGRKRINNILTVLSKALRYAADAKLIVGAPKVGLLKVERPEIEYWEFDAYARILESARAESPEWYAAVCLTGEAGLRIGEVKALKWQERVDLIAGTITISEQTCHGITGTPKGGRRRIVPMTATLHQALKALEVVRVGYVVRNLDGSALTDGQATHAIRRIIRRAGLPERGWHSLRHSFGTHAALLGVNPWRLQAWMGHGRIDETMLYVHVAGAHLRPLPPELRQVPPEADPDRRILALLSARAQVQPAGRGIQVAFEESAAIPENEKGLNLGEVQAF